MGRLIRGWKKDEFSAPTETWSIKLEGRFFDKSKGKYVKLSGSAVKLTYLFLVHVLDVYGEVFPSYKTIAQYTELAPKTVQRCVAYLEEIGLIHKINRYTEEGYRTSNEYIIYHPKQIPNLPKIDSKSKLEDSESQRMDSESKPKIKGESEKPSIHGMVSESKRLDSETNNICLSVGQSVCMNKSQDQTNQPEEKEQADRKEVREYWKKAFKEEIDEIQLDEIMSFGFSVEKTIEVIRGVYCYVPIQTTPFRVVAAALAAEAKGNGWKFHENAGEMKPERKKAQPKKATKKGNQKPDKLPESLRLAKEVEGNAADPEGEKRIRAKIQLLNKKFPKSTTS